MATASTFEKKISSLFTGRARYNCFKKASPSAFRIQIQSGSFGVPIWNIAPGPWDLLVTYFTPHFLFSYFDGFVCQKKHQHDISRTRWGMELKISSFEIFNSLSCLITNILHITLTVTWLHNNALDGWYCKKNSRLKRKLRNVSVFPRHFTKSLW